MSPEEQPLPAMELNPVRALRGPNRWTDRTAVEATVELRDAEGLSVDFAERLRARLPGFAGEPGPTLAHALERVALLLQQQAGCAVGFGHTENVGERLFKVVVEYGEEEVGRRALEVGARLLEAALADAPFDAPAEIAALRTLDEQERLGPTTASIAAALARRGVPVRRMTDGNLLQLGWGVRQRRVWTAETDRTGAVAEAIAKDKELTKTLLRAVGVPVPEGRPAGDAEEAWAIAQELGAPVALKPLDGNHGRGVAVGLTTREQVAAAFAAARSEGERVLVERAAKGADHRLLVIGGRLVAAARRDPPRVTGDGERTVAQLVEEANQDPRRGEDHATSLSKLCLDEIAVAVLAEQGLGPDAVPPAGAEVVLRRNANLSTGGSAEDVTDRVHPEVAARAVEAARAVGLDIAGVDLVCEDPGRPLEEQGGVVLEVNAGPGFRMHLSPSSGRARPVGEAVADALFGPGEDGRIPLVAVSGNNGKTTTTRLVAHVFETLGRCVGMTCSDGLYVGGRRLDTGDCAGPKSAKTVLFHPRVEAAVLETARGGILREGLGFDRCDVAVVTNIGGGDHLGLGGITTPEQLAQVKATVVRQVAPGGAAVLNAADPLSAGMSGLCPGRVILFARDPAEPRLAAHLAAGERAVFAEGGRIVAAEGSEALPVVALEAVPMTHGGQIGFQVENALAATAAAWAAGVPWETVREALSSFVTDTRHVPGRFNVLAHRGATVIADYGHNPDALRAIVEAIESMPAARRVAVLSAAGDRREVDILRIGQAVGDAFDEVVLFEDACNRGRAEGEVISLLRRGVEAGRRVSTISEHHGELVAMEAGLRALAPGHLLLALVDQIELSVAFLESCIFEERPASPRGRAAEAA